jgi:hypothetical protein
VWAVVVAGGECAPSSIERVRLSSVQCWTEPSLVRSWVEVVVEICWRNRLDLTGEQHSIFSSSKKELQRRS